MRRWAFDAHNRCRIYDCRGIPNSQTIGQLLAVEGESIYNRLNLSTWRSPSNQCRETLANWIARNRYVFGSAKLPIKVPIMRAFRNGAAPFALLVFADVVLHTVQQPIAVLPFDGALQCFLHARWHSAGPIRDAARARWVQAGEQAQVRAHAAAAPAAAATAPHHQQT